MNAAAANLEAAYVMTVVHLSRSIAIANLARDADQMTAEAPEDEFASPHCDWRSCPQMPAPTMAPHLEGGWRAIDHVPISACYCSPFMHLQDVPTAHIESWALAFVDVLELKRDCATREEEDRALKWMMLLHDLLFRLPPRGGRRGHNVATKNVTTM